MSITVQAYRELLRLEYPLFRKAFPAIYDRVRRTPVALRPRKTLSCTEICQAVDLAAVLYFRRVLCLQRSAATACLLKRYGFPAQLVIGVQQLPFAAHAWVEMGGLVINDKPYMSDIYSVLARC
jgi:hypothetical protein